MKYKPFGLMHRTWDYPTCFLYDTAEEAAAMIRKVYGDNSGHRVVRVIELEEQA